MADERINYLMECMDLVVDQMDFLAFPEPPREPPAWIRDVEAVAREMDLPEPGATVHQLDDWAARLRTVIKERK